MLNIVFDCFPLMKFKCNATFLARRGFRCFLLGTRAHPSTTPKWVKWYGYLRPGDGTTLFFFVFFTHKLSFLFGISHNTLHCMNG